MDVGRWNWMLELEEETRATSNEKIPIEKKKNYGGEYNTRTK